MSLAVVIEWDTFPDAEVPANPPALEVVASQGSAPERPRGRRLTAGAPLSVLVSALARAGWGALAGPEFRCVRSILSALATAAHHSGLDKAGECVITRHQLANHAGYSTKQIQRWMPIIEYENLVWWTRGMIINGTPTPGRLRVNKRMLMRYITDARAKNDTREARRREATRARLRRLKKLRIPRRTPKPLTHGDTVTHLPPSQGRRGAHAPRPHTTGEGTPQKNNVSLSPKETTEMPLHEYMPDTCHHKKGNDPYRCNACRFEAMRRENEAKKAAATARAHAEKQRKEVEEAKAAAWLEYMQSHYGHLTPRQWVRISNDGSDPEATRLNRPVTA